MILTVSLFNELIEKWEKFADTDHSQGMKLSDSRKQGQHELIMAGQSLAYATAAKQLRAAIAAHEAQQAEGKPTGGDSTREQESDYDQKAVDIIKNLSMLVRRLAHKHPNEKLKDQAIGYLQGEGLQGSILRGPLEMDTQRAVAQATHTLKCGHPANAQVGDEYGHASCQWCVAIAQARVNEAEWWENAPCGEYDDGSRAERIADLERDLAAIAKEHNDAG